MAFENIVATVMIIIHISVINTNWTEKDNCSILFLKTVFFFLIFVFVLIIVFIRFNLADQCDFQIWTLLSIRSVEVSWIKQKWGGGDEISIYIPCSESLPFLYNNRLQMKAYLINMALLCGLLSWSLLLKYNFQILLFNENPLS